MYFKILREDLTHHGYIYQEGLNVYSKPYDSIPSNREGLFFTDIENISEFYSCGNKIAEVILRIIRLIRSFWERFGIYGL